MKKSILKGISFLTRMTSLLFTWRFRFDARLHLKKNTWGPGFSCLVPVRTGGGAGVLEIMKDNIFGYPSTVRLGRGKLLLQPRTPESRIVLGAHGRYSNNVAIIAWREICIGDHFLYGGQILIVDSNFHEIAPKLRNSGHGKTSPVKIGNNVWLGSRCIILKGEEISDNAIVAPMKVVSRNVPANAIVGENPERLIGTI